MQSRVETRKATVIRAEFTAFAPLGNSAGGFTRIAYQLAAGYVPAHLLRVVPPRTGHGAFEFWWVLLRFDTPNPCHLFGDGI